MGATKYPILDADFKLKMLGACRNDEERGLVSVLWLTGMHICILSNDEDRPRPRLVREGSRTYIYWKRAKNSKELRQLIPKDMLPTVEGYLTGEFGRRKCRRYNFDLVRQIGERAGFENVSPNTFRHSRCMRALLPKDQGGDGLTIFEVPHVLGCSLDIALKNYAALSQEQYDDKMWGKEATDAEEGS